MDQYLKFTAAEQQRVFQNRQKVPAEDRTSKKTRGIASADSEKLLRSMEKLTKKIEKTDRRIASLETAMSDDETSIFSDHESVGDNRTNPALCRQSKKKSKKSKKSRN